MIRLRNQKGEVTDVPRTNAVEYVDSDGKLAVVITQDTQGSVHILTPGDPTFNAYCRTQRMFPSRVHIHEPFAGKPLSHV